MDNDFTHSLFEFTWMPGQEGPDDGGSAAPKDPGGFTRLGVTQVTWNAWKTTHGLDPVGALTLGFAPLRTLAQIYYNWFWLPCRPDPNIDTSIAFMLFDFGVTTGPAHAIKHLQEVLGFTGRDVDGIFGPATRRNYFNSHFTISAVINELADKQMAFYRGLPGYSDFGEGWETRTQRRTAVAHFYDARGVPEGSLAGNTLYQKFLAQPLT